jgi:hypothetical protein
MKSRITTGLVTLALIAGAAGVTVSAQPPVVSADSAGNVDITFTKWVTSAKSFPWDMAGVVGGDVSAGTFAGEALSSDMIVNGTIDVIHAHYRINGGSQQLTADLLVIENEQTNTAVSNGIVTDGWMEGARVQGKYTVLPVCPIATPHNVLGTVCYQGSLRIIAGPAGT